MSKDINAEDTELDPEKTIAYFQNHHGWTPEITIQQLLTPLGQFMIEQEWLISTQPERMIQLLTTHRFRAASKNDSYLHLLSEGDDKCRICGKLRRDNCKCGASDRKLRLLIVAIGRMSDIWEIEESRENLLFVEESDGDEGAPSGFAVHNVAECAYEFCLARRDEIPGAAERADLVRDIFGNPFQKVSLPEGQAFVECWKCGRISVKKEQGICPLCDKKAKIWGTEACPWLSQDVIALANSAYCNRIKKRCEFCRGTGGLFGPPTKMPDGTTKMYGGRCKMCPKLDDWHGTGEVGTAILDCTELCVLADALQDAGCSNSVVINHLLSPGPHVRGCWVLDLLLGRT